MPVESPERRLHPSIFSTASSSCAQGCRLHWQMITIFHSTNSLEKILVVWLYCKNCLTDGALNAIDCSSSTFQQYVRNIAMKINLQPKWKKYIVALYLHLWELRAGFSAVQGLFPLNYNHNDVIYINVIIMYVYMHMCALTHSHTRAHMYIIFTRYKEHSRLALFLQVWLRLLNQRCEHLSNECMSFLTPAKMNGSGWRIYPGAIT